MRTSTSKNIKAYTLLATIFFGGLLAPASHLLYMTVSDVHVMDDQRSDIHVPHSDLKSLADGSSVSAESGHYECPYLLLFATSSVADAPAETTCSDSEAELDVCLLADEDAPVTVSCAANPVRGPPGTVFIS